jgi:hypothetical protein
MYFVITARLGEYVYYYSTPTKLTPEMMTITRQFRCKFESIKVAQIKMKEMMRSYSHLTNWEIIKSA